MQWFPWCSQIMIFSEHILVTERRKSLVVTSLGNMAEFGACVVQKLFTFALLILNFLDQDSSPYVCISMCACTCNSAARGNCELWNNPFILSIIVWTGSSMPWAWKLCVYYLGLQLCHWLLFYGCHSVIRAKSLFLSVECNMHNVKCQCGFQSVGREQLEKVELQLPMSC
jgi:hypothetical protein